MAELFVADEIKKLKELLDSGALTEAEFTELKQQVIRKATSGKQESFQETVTSRELSVTSIEEKVYWMLRTQ